MMNESAGEAVEDSAEPRGRLRVGWLWAGFALLLVIGWMMYDVLWPQLALARVRDVVREQVHVGDTWESADRGVRAQGYSSRFWTRTSRTSETIYMVKTGRPPSRTLFAWNKAMIWGTRYTRSELPYLGIYEPRVFVDTSGTVTRVMVD
jgi:hypothetical protein